MPTLASCGSTLRGRRGTAQSCPRRWRRLEAYMSLRSQGTPVKHAPKNVNQTVMTVRQLLSILNDDIQGVDTGMGHTSQRGLYLRVLSLYICLIQIKAN